MNFLGVTIVLPFWYIIFRQGVFAEVEDEVEFEVELTKT